MNSKLRTPNPKSGAPKNRKNLQTHRYAVELHSLGKTHWIKPENVLDRIGLLRNVAARGQQSGVYTTWVHPLGGGEVWMF